MRPRTSPHNGTYLILRQSKSTPHISLPFTFGHTPPNISNDGLSNNRMVMPFTSNRMDQSSATGVIHVPGMIYPLQIAKVVIALVTVYVVGLAPFSRT